MIRNARVRSPRRGFLSTATVLAAVAALWLFGASAAAAADGADAHRAPLRVDSPGQVLTVELDLAWGGRLVYRVSRFGEPVIADSRLGFNLANGDRLDRHLVVVDEARRSVDTTWEQPWGERRFVRDRHNELRVRLAERAGARRQLVVVFRVFDDGVGFRYEFPDQPALKDVTIADELTEFVVAAPSTAWWIPAGEPTDLELPIRQTSLAELTVAHTPLTLRTRDGLHIAVHEAALVDYAGMRLRRAEEQRLVAELAPSSEGWRVRRAAPFSTPWRTIQVADGAPALYRSSDLILNLNEPNRLGDVSWIKPGKFIGIWWEMHLDRWSWSTGPRHGATTANAKRYIDFAAKNGLRGVLVEGWNVGWDGDWQGGGDGFDFTRATPDFDLPAVAAYARARHVSLIGHHETGGAVSHYEDQLPAALDLYRRVGVDTVKTGYVTDADQIERRDAAGVVRREWHDGQFMARHHLTVVTEAARRHIAIDAHEPIKDTGLRRTYPNWMSREGARGMEWNAWGDPVNPPGHEAALVFTRMLAGPFDFTPGIFALDPTRPGCRVKSTLAKQLALYVVLYSPLQMAADRIESYEANPRPFQFIKDVPTDWAETIVVNGEIGDYVTIARKDRRGDDWYLGSITDEDGRLLDVPLSFLDPRRRYRAQIYRDGTSAHWKTAPLEILIEEKEVSSADTLTLRLAAGGGQAIRFVALPARP
ncbi:MAG TPA: glycoside hydrolase family 97 protein [Polyangia bacterium]|nr:glycoside hydrolase family 97 protein [Polyangia bacterium]